MITTTTTRRDCGAGSKRPLHRIATTPPTASTVRWNPAPIGIRAVKISLLALGATAVAQIVVVVISGSIALAADTIHNFSDALTAVPLWIAFALSTRAATRRYTYGFGRAEDLAGLFVVAMITLSAIIAGYEAIARLINPRADRPCRLGRRGRSASASSATNWWRSTASGLDAESAQPR